MEKVYITTNGCAVLRHETYKIAKYIELNGYEEVDVPDKADYIIITGCAVINSNEEQILNIIRSIHGKHSNHAKIIVAGCVPTISSDKIDEISKNIIKIDNKNMCNFDNIFYKNIKLNDVTFNINPKMHHSKGDPNILISENERADIKLVEKVKNIICNTRFEEQFKYSTRGRHLWLDSDLFEIRVSYGCSNNCSYCATKLAIGDFRSVPEEIILNQAKIAKEQGYDKIMLMGDEIGAWHEGKKNIVNLIEDILKINDQFKIGIRYIHPDVLAKNYEQLRPMFKKGNIFYFCSAFQSGSRKILKLMNRNPELGLFLNCMEDISKNNFPVFCHTQVIVGFPTETDEDFFDTVAALQKASFDHITITPYSAREGTVSYNYENIPEEVLIKRMNLLNSWLELNRDSKLYKSLRKYILECEVQ